MNNALRLRPIAVFYSPFKRLLCMAALGLAGAGLPLSARAAEAQPHRVMAAGLTALEPLSYATARQPVRQYRITAIAPQEAVGQLYIGATPVTAPRPVSLAEAAQLRFRPAAGLTAPATFAFSYAADEGLQPGPAAVYTIAVQPASQLDFSTVTESAAGAYDVEGVRVTGLVSAADVAGPLSRLLAVGRNRYLPGVSLQWQQSFRDQDPALAPNASTYTLTFSRPVAQLSLLLTDVDQHLTFTDVLTVAGYATADAKLPAAPAQVRMATGASNCRRPGTNTVAGTRNSDAQPFGSAAADNGAVVISFAQPVQRVQLTYENQAPYQPGGSRLQAIGLAALTWARPETCPLVAVLPSQPAPGAATATVDLRQQPAGTYRAHLFRLNGKKQHTYQVRGGQLNELSLAAIAPGVYALWLEGRPGNRTVRLVKE